MKTMITKSNFDMRQSKIESKEVDNNNLKDGLSYYYYCDGENINKVSLKIKRRDYSFLDDDSLKLNL